MKLFKPTRMFWIYALSVTTGMLALLSGFLQYLEDSKRKKEELESANELKDAYRKLADKSEEINNKSDTIMLLQEAQKKEVKEKTDQIIALQNKLDEKNESLITAQKENLDYLTGGDSMVRIIVPPIASSYPNDYAEITVGIYNQSKYPQYDVQIEVSNNIKVREAFKIIPSPTDSEAKDLFNKLIKEATSFTYFDKIESKGRREIYKTNLPNSENEVILSVFVKSRNGNYTNEIHYVQKDNTGWWELQNVDYYFKDIGK